MTVAQGTRWLVGEKRARIGDMKRITITIDEHVALWARVWAARHDTSVSQLLGDMLRERMLCEEGYEVAMQQYLGAPPRRLKQTGSYPTRGQIHERSPVLGENRG